MIKTHYCNVIRPDAYHPQIIGYNVWAWRGHVLLGQINGSHICVKKKAQAQKTAQKIREYFNEGKELSIPANWILETT